MTAKSLYTELERYRSGPLERARECSALTIPSIVPPEGYDGNAPLESPWQSLGARGVNNLASKLLLALFPPGAACFRYTLTKSAMEGAAEGELTEVKEALAAREREITEELEATQFRNLASEAINHLIVAGNGLLCMKASDDMRFYGMDQYVMRRSGSGDPLDLVVLEEVHPTQLTEEVRNTCEVDPDAEKIEVYTQVEWRDGKVEHWQEINDIEVPSSRGSAKKEVSPWIPMRWKAVAGSHWGRGHVEEIKGDLVSLDGISEAIVMFAAAAAKIVFLCHPNGTTRMEDINDAESGDAVTGTMDDIDILSLEKFADFRVANMVAERLEQRISYAFLLRAGATRDAERVTAEEIRALAQELEDVVGGVYTVQGREFQLPVVTRSERMFERERKIVPLPSGTVKPMIVTGFQALGRNHALNKLRGMLTDMVQIGGQEALRTIKQGNLAKRLGTAYGVEDLEELFKTDEELAQEQEQAQQQAMMQTLMDKGAGPMAGAAAKQMIEE